jgi:phosphonatase-like hydrolase
MTLAFGIAERLVDMTGRGLVIELVVFDMAGTTVHDGDAVGGAFHAALASAGVAVEREAVEAVRGLAKPLAIRRLLAEARGPAADPEVAAIHADFVRRMQRYYAEDPAVREVPGASEAFRRLRQAGVYVALNTGFSRSIVEPLLARLDWRGTETVDAVVTSDEVERGRPYPDMIRLLMGQLGVTDPAAVAKVGDTWADLEEGAQAGCGLVIGVTTGTYSREKLRERSHTHIVASVADVPGVILR